MGPVQRITESIVHDALPLPKVGAVIGGKKVTSVKVTSTDRDYYTTGITLERGAKRKDIQAGLSELLNCHILNSKVGDLAVRVTHFEMVPTKKGPTIYIVMRIVPMVYNNPGKGELSALEDFNEHYGPKFTAKSPKKWFRNFPLRNPHGPAHRDKLWKFVGWVGESYGYCDKHNIYHRRASTIMPKIKITKAIDGADTFYHTHPSKDEPSLSSPDDYMLYFDLAQEPRNIRHFYTIMKDRIDYFKITPRKENRNAYVRIDQDKFLDEVDAKIDELMDKHSDDFPDDKQGGLEFCEKVTKETVKWLNKKYGKYVKITYSCFYRVRKNPEESDFTNLHLGDSFIARAIADIRSGDYSWPSADVNKMPQEKYAYWFGQYYFMDDDPEKQVGLLASPQETQSVGRVRDRTKKLGFLPGRLRGVNHYLDLKIHEDYSNYDMMNLMNLHIDIMRLDSNVTDGGGVKTRLEELAKQLELPDEIRDNLIMIEEARILGAHTEEAKTLSGDFYIVLLLVDLCQRAIEVMDEVRAGTKTLEYAKYEIYAKLKQEAIRLIDIEITAYMKAFNQGKKSMRLNPPPRFKKGEFEAFIPPEYLQATGIVTEALEQYAPYQEGKPFLTGRNKVNMRVPSNGTVSTVMIGSLNTGNLQIIVPAKGHPMPEDASATALGAYQAVVDRLNEYGLNIPTEEQEVGSVTVSNPRKNNQLIIIAGPSGAGKSTTLRNLDKMLPNSKLIRSYVTRPKRKSDRSEEKNFVSEKQFKEMVANGEFLEHTRQKSGDYYGKRLEDFKVDADYLITESSLPGVNRLKKAFPNAFTIYLEPSESAEMIRKRLLRRGDMSPQQARGRSSKIPSHIKSSKMMSFDKRIITKQGQFDNIALEIMDSIPKNNPGIPFRVPKEVRPEIERRLTEEMRRPGYKPQSIADAIDEGIYDDQPSDFSYAQGEYEEFLEEIEKGDMDEAYAEYSDVEGHVAYWNYTNLGIETPIYSTIHLEKTRKRIKVFADIFADFGLKMDSKYLKGGSNFQKTTKVRLALETAAQDQGVPFNATDNEIRDSINKAVPDVVMENPSYPINYYNAHLHTSRSTNNFFPGDVPVAPPDLLRGNPSKKPVSVRIEESPNKEKKMVAYFYDKDGKKVKTTHFGARGMSDFTQHKDPKRMKRYLARHGKMGEDWKDPTTAGALSRWILWGKPSLRESFNDYKKKFRLEGVMTVTNTKMNPKRIPKKYEGQDPSEHSDLFTDEDPNNTIKGLGFKDKETAERSIEIIRRADRTHAHKMQAAMAMEQRARFHAHQTPGIRAGQKVYAKFIEEMKKKTKEMRKNPAYTSKFDFIPGKEYTFDELPGYETGRVVTAFEQEYGPLGTSLREDAIHHFRSKEEGGYGFPGTAQEATYRAVIIPNEELVEQFGHLRGKPKLQKHIEKHGLDYPSIGNEGNNRRIAMAKLGRDMPHLEVIPVHQNPSRTPEGRKIPKKYLKGLNREEMAIAAREIDKGYKYDVDDPKAYEEWKSDIKAKARGYKTVPSKYKKKFIEMYGPLPEKGEFLDKMAKATGIKKSILKKVYDKGLAAWATGHRVGVAPHQWATGRVYSFVTLGNTVKKGNKKMPDYSLAVEAGLVKNNPPRHNFVEEKEDPFSTMFV